MPNKIEIECPHCGQKIDLNNQAKIGELAREINKLSAWEKLVLSIELKKYNCF